MAELDFIIQAVTSSNHGQAIRKMFSIENPGTVLISVAYARETGVAEIEDLIKACAQNTRAFVGIRNDITSVQAIKRLLAAKASVYAVDTATRMSIFHTKLYVVANKTRASFLIGSANLTFGGLYNNIEASALIDLNLTQPTHKAFLDKTIASFDNILRDHPQHAFQITGTKQADRLFAAGRLEDEDVIPPPTTGTGVKRGLRDALPPMNLRRAFPPRPKVRAGKLTPENSKPSNAPAQHVKAKALDKSRRYHLVWESNPLSRRALNIPVKINTHATGSMGLGKGAVVSEFDHRHYFRKIVFAGLNWMPEKAHPHLELASASFKIVIKNLDYGNFSLTIRHNTDTTSKAYQQRNEMTHLRWGEVKQLVAQGDLLGRTLYLYRQDTNPPIFMIEID